jgi:hypothetical protein
VTERVLPKPGVSRDDASHAARRNGWQYHDLFLADGEQPFEKVWLNEPGDTSIHWIEDPILDLDYFVVQGAHQGEIADELREDFPTYSRDELRAGLDDAQDWPAFLLALQRAAAAAPPAYDPEIAGWFDRGFGHEEPAVRKMAAILTSYPGWPELRPALERLGDDEDAEVRSVAQSMLAQS